METELLPEPNAGNLKYEPRTEIFISAVIVQLNQQLNLPLSLIIFRSSSRLFNKIQSNFLISILESLWCIDFT